MISLKVIFQVVISIGQEIVCLHSFKDKVFTEQICNFC